MKRVISLLLILAGFAAPACAVKKVSIAQFEQAVAAFHTRPDAEVAFLVADMQLTERLSPTRVASLGAMVPGEVSRQALAAVADASQFQPPPPDELPATALPDLAAQKRIMGLAATYVVKTIPNLPNFLAARETSFFEDTPLLQRSEDWSTPYQPLHLVGRSTTAVLFRDGREVEEKSKLAREQERGRGLHSSGEFGPILALILVDAAQNRLAFSRWENGTLGLEAVFSYQVPREKSHYSVDYCCVANQSPTAVADTLPFHQIAAYHGEIAVDPQKGSIVRISVIAELKPGSPVTRADLLVEYAPVEIGGKAYTCPSKGIAITTAQMVQLQGRLGFPLARQLQPLKTMLNEVIFKDYHVFRSESRVLAQNQDNNVPPIGASESSGSDASRSDSDASISGYATVAEAANAEAPDSPPDRSPNPATQPIQSPPELKPAAPERTLTGDAVIPDTPALSSQAPAASGFRLRTTSRLVDIGLVAYDKKGRPVIDLRNGDFEIYDNGRKQEIRYFVQASHDPLPLNPLPSPQPAPEPAKVVYSNRQMESPLQPRTAAAGSHATIFLIDASNLAWFDLQYARQEMLRFLKALPQGDQVGLYILRSYGFQILLEPTSDHSLIATTLSRWMPDARDLARAQDEEQRNRQHFDWVLHPSDLAYVNGNDGSDPEQSYSGNGRVAAAQNTVDPQLRSMGNNPMRNVLENLQMVARHLGTIPGHKALVWVSSDNALADWSSQAASPEDKGQKFIESVAVRAREALNEAHVSIYPLDSSQLEGGAITADLENRLIQAKLPPRPGEPPPPPPNPAGRYAAQMHQDTHAIAPEFQQLAEATGGRALRRAGDIAAELNGIAEDGRAAYQLSFTPDTPADGKYHLITVKLPRRRDLKLRYRTGYLYEQEPATLKDRFRQAIWQPRDVTDIALTATRDTASPSPGLQLNIAATDLEMAQNGDRWTDKLDMFLIERDDDALHARTTGRTLALQLMPATYQKALHDGIDVDQPLPAKSEARSFRIVVVDLNSGRMGSITVPAGHR